MSTRSELLSHYKATGDIRFLDAIAALDHWKIGMPGAPLKWRRRDLIRLWALVQAFIYDGKTASDACRFLSAGDGFGYSEDDGATKIVIKNHRRLNRLYNDAATLVNRDPKAAADGDRQKRQYIFARHPGDKKMAKQVERDKIEADRAFKKSLRELATTIQRAKNQV